LKQPIEEKIEIIAKEVYGAAGIELSPEAIEQIKRYKAQVSFNHFLIHFKCHSGVSIRVSTICQFAWPKPTCHFRMTHR
jgi:formyltetrahydrofolate synthetase